MIDYMNRLIQAHVIGELEPTIELNAQQSATVQRNLAGNLDWRRSDDLRANSNYEGFS